MKRFPFLDWMRGLAIVIMIQCHTFNSFTRTDLWTGGPYLLSQFVGGMAAPLFLFMAGMTLAFQMDGLDRREPDALRRWLRSLRRAGYILGIAFAFRLSCFVASLPGADPHEIVKVDILNCMGVGMAAFSVAAVFDAKNRARFAAAAGLAIAAAAPLVANLPWAGAPLLLRQYLAAEPGVGRFAFFPCAAYIGFGLAAGAIVKRTETERFERLMQWSVLTGVGLVLGGEYFSSIPYSLYTKSNFWSDSPVLVLIRAGLLLVMMAGAYLWTEHAAGAGWSWMQTLGKNSLMVYWVHVMLVYGGLVARLKRALEIPQAALATVVVVLLMLGLSVAWMGWKKRRAERRMALPKASDSPLQLERVHQV